MRTSSFQWTWIVIALCGLTASAASGCRSAGAPGPQWLGMGKTPEAKHPAPPSIAAVPNQPHSSSTVTGGAAAAPGAGSLAHGHPYAGSHPHGSAAAGAALPGSGTRGTAAAGSAWPGAASPAAQTGPAGGYATGPYATGGAAHASATLAQQGPYGTIPGQPAGGQFPAAGAHADTGGVRTADNRSSIYGTTPYRGTGGQYGSPAGQPAGASDPGAWDSQPYGTSQGWGGAPAGAPAGQPSGSWGPYAPDGASSNSRQEGHHESHPYGRHDFGSTTTGQQAGASSGYAQSSAPGGSPWDTGGSPWDTGGGYDAPASGPATAADDASVASGQPYRPGSTARSTEAFRTAQSQPVQPATYSPHALAGQDPSAGSHHSDPYGSGSGSESARGSGGSYYGTGGYSSPAGSTQEIGRDPYSQSIYR